MLTMDNLEKCFESATKVGAKYIGIAFELPNTPKPELIINPSENFEAKLEYYKKVYSHDLKVGPVRIIGFTFGDGLGDIRKDLGL